MLDCNPWNYPHRACETAELAVAKADISKARATARSFEYAASTAGRSRNPELAGVLAAASRAAMTGDAGAYARAVADVAAACGDVDYTWGSILGE